MVEFQNIRKFVIIFVALAIIISIVLGGIFAVQNLFLDWKMLDAMYINKAGVSWWATYTINGFLFTVGLPAAAIITLAGPLHESKVLNLLWLNRRVQQRRPSLRIVAVYKILLFVGSYLVLTFIFTDNMRMLALLSQAAVSSVGSWGEIGQAITLIFTPMAPVETVASLVATIEVEYTIFLILMSLLLIVIGIRVVLDLIHYFARIGRSTRYPEVRVLASISFLAVLGLLWMLLTVPYLEVDVGTQFFVFHLLILFIFSCVLTGISFGLTVFGRFGRGGEIPRMNQRFLAGLGIVTIALIVGPGLYTGYLVSGPIQGQLWEDWHWDPLMTKELNFTNWAGGAEIDEVPYMSLVNDTGVSDGHVLGHARLWDFDASRNKMRAQTIANWMALADSDIVYMGGREYWIAPYSLAPPSREDFHKSYILYTHAEGATALDASSTTGEFLSAAQFQSIFGVNANFPIYYGESPTYEYIDGYEGFVLVDTTIAPETGTYSWEGEPDYTLVGAELALKKLAWAFSDLSFAWLSYSDPEAKVLMLRNIQERVQSILLPFLYTDYDPYLVFDQINHEAYYCVPIFSAYPLQLQYARVPYLRLLGWSVVNCADGTITWVRNPNANPAQFFIETMYESWYPWIDPPSWILNQLRYPEELIDLQLSVDFYYHVTDAWVWRSESDFFEKPDSQPDIHYVLYPINGSLTWVGYQAVRYIRHEAQKMAGYYLFYNGPKVGTALFARAGILDPTTQTPLTPVFGVDAAIQSFKQYARSDLVLIEPYRIGNRLLMPLSGMLVYLFPVYAEESGEQLVETLKYVGIVDAEDINNVAYATTVAEAYSSFFYGYNETVTGVDFIDTNIDPFDISVGEEAELGYIVKNGNSTACNVTLQLGIHSANFDVEYHGANVTPIFDSGVYLYNVGMSLMYPNDVMGGSITLLAKSLDPGIYLATFILELKIIVNGNPTESEYFYLTVRST